MKQMKSKNRFQSSQIEWESQFEMSFWFLELLYLAFCCFT